MARQGFDVDRVTKRFIDRFQVERAAFARFIGGSTCRADRERYAALLLNRLMVLYFLRGKELVDRDRAALRRRLQSGQGDLFDVHELETAHPDIRIADAAFERLFDFFDAYQWTLDGQLRRADNEIDPTILGQVFEKYVHPQRMGAYYTRTDITGYIARNTIIPFLFRAAEKLYPDALHPEAELWRRLQEEPDRYIFPAASRGVDRPLPPSVARGLTNVAARTDWNQPAAADVALPTETWREHIARRQRCGEVRHSLRSGAIRSIDAVITCNLDIGRFAVDAIESCPTPQLLRAFYHAIATVTILDPTCGCGAFLFAALDVLQPLYEACLDRMTAFVADAQRAGTHHPDSVADFRELLQTIARHPSQPYWIIQAILARNLYGVDIMEEAVEICRLQLFLKLLAAVGDVAPLKALPAIACNMRTGNALVGFATRAEVNAPWSGTLDLDRCLAVQYGIDSANTREFRRWQLRHRPFNWFAQFPEVARRGGFDVIIGNPPYIEYRRIADRYRIAPDRYQTEPAGNLYAFCVERSGDLLRDDGRLGMIVPSGAVALDETASLRSVLRKRYATLHCSTYAIRPSRLFDGVDQRLCIILGDGTKRTNSRIYTTRYHHWNAVERSHLFTTLAYVASAIHPRLERLAQVGHRCARNVLCRIEQQSVCLVQHYLASTAVGVRAHYHRSPRYWIRALDFEPYFQSAIRSRSIHHFRDLWFTDRENAQAVCAIINSSLYFFWFTAIGNGRNLTSADVASFPVGRLGPIAPCLAEHFNELMANYRANSFIRQRADCAYQEFRASSAKPILDRIDTVLARHYGLADEELDFVLNHEIKYRLGRDAAD